MSTALDLQFTGFSIKKKVACVFNMVQKTLTFGELRSCSIINSIIDPTPTEALVYMMQNNQVERNPVMSIRLNV